jgi:T5orf172 domain
MTSPIPTVEAELREVIAANPGNMGQVYALLEEVKTSNAELVEAGAVANTGAASNLKIVINAILTGQCPTSPSLAAQAGRTIGGILRNNESLSDNGRTYLLGLRSEFDDYSQNNEAVEREVRELDKASEDLERSIENLDGVYVYTYPTYLRTVQMSDPERFLFKVGKTEQFSSVRIKGQQRATNMPEDPCTQRVYRSSSMTPHEIESRFHMMLVAAGHGRSMGKRAGKEWFFTNLEYLDAIATMLGLEIHKPSELP